MGQYKTGSYQESMDAPAPLMFRALAIKKEGDVSQEDDDLRQMLVLMGTITVVSFVIVVTLLSMAVFFIW